MTTPRDPVPSQPPEITVRTPDRRTYRFRSTFVIGRDRDCDVRLDDGRVSRRHARGVFERGEWRIEDLDSGNGLYVGDRRVQSAPVKPAATVRLGPDGPQLDLDAELQVGETIILSDYMERYFKDEAGDRPVGKDTVMIRKAFKRVQQRQRRTYVAAIGVVAAVALVAAGYAYYNYRQVRQQQSIAEEMFYSMKAIDVSLAALEVKLLASGGAQGQEDVQRYRERRRELEANYERFLSGLSGRQFSPQEQSILRVTRLFGECEVAAPPEYLAEVMTYIRRWQSTKRYASAVGHAQQMGYVPRIVQAFQQQNLPPQFFYLAMQESDFIETRTGPPTRMGFAKGMWMFIPDTGRRYGLTIGPLQAYARPDPQDDRHNWEKATRAAAAYIKDIYSTDAQASGLLVMASYNWGEGRIINLLRSMPANPRERNFWQLLVRYRERVPKETYDYVLSIVSAAAIGENPRLFGFNFDNPLGQSVALGLPDTPGLPDAPGGSVGIGGRASR